MRIRALLLSTFIMSACGDDDGAIAGDGGNDAPSTGDAPLFDAPPIDAVPLCSEIPTGAGPPSPSAGAGWARASTGEGSALASLARASDGALFLGGRLAEGSLTLGSASVTATGSEVFVAKLTAGGMPLWARATSGTSDVFAGFHAAAAGDGLVFGGGFAGSLTVNPSAGSPVVLSTTGMEAPFVARWNADGSLAWARTGTATMTGRAVAFAANADGVWACGDFLGTLTMGPGETNQTALTGSGEDLDAWVARFASTGDLVWAVPIAATGRDVCRAIAVQSDGASVMVGMEGGDIAVRGFTADGVSRFAKVIDGTGISEEATDVALFANGDFVVSGFFDDEAVFGAGEGGETTLPAPPGAAGFVARYLADGTVAWARLVTRPVNDVATRADGSLWGVGSSLTPGVVLNECRPDRLQLTMFDEDLFLARWDASGRLTYATQQGNYWSQFGTAVVDVPTGAAVSGAFIYGGTFYSGTVWQAMFQDTYTNVSHPFVLGLDAP
jgi:hypothetical protein